MGKPAARITDFHMCPMVTPGVPPIPHVGGPILPPGVPTVLIGGLPAATLGSMCVCTGPPDSIILGSIGVLIGGRPAARMGDQCAHGGMIMAGLPTVLIGEIGAPSGGSPGGFAAAANAMPTPIASKMAQVVALTHAAEKGLPYAIVPESVIEVVKFLAPPNEEETKRDEIKFRLLDPDGNPVADEKYKVTLPDGSVKIGKTDSNGEVYIAGVKPGNCKISFTDIDGNDWA